MRYVIFYKTRSSSVNKNRRTLISIFFNSKHAQKGSWIASLRSGIFRIETGAVRLLVAQQTDRLDRIGLSRGRAAAFSIEEKLTAACQGRYMISGNALMNAMHSFAQKR